MATQTPSSSTSEHTKIRKRGNSSCSEEDEKIITSSPTSSSTPRWKYEVFLSFYGKDTRMSFTDHLYVDLKRKGILVFRDDEALKRGKCISQELSQAIQESQSAIVIFSAKYASSEWCLRELAEIVEWEEKNDLIIIPIFYHVDPSDVRNQRGTFKEAFAAHEKDPKVDIKEIDTWRNACIKVGNLAGEHIKGDRYESTIIKEIGRRIAHELNSRFSRHDYNKLVAIDSHVDRMIELLDMESDDVRFVGIHGMGGVGKTMLAEIIYDRVSNCRFEGSSFISCIREESKARGLASLQKQLLSMIMEEKIQIWDQNHGDRMRKKILHNKKVFIVLDDVDSDEQLTALAGDRKWFGPGSRVIITCRDSHLLRRYEVNPIYKVEQLEIAEALQLFSLSAFKETHPIEDYMDLSMDFVNYAQGLPLALKVLGSFLYEREIDAWKSEKDKLKAFPNPKIMDVLQISFNGLQKSQKDLFLDMACYFRGQHGVDYIFDDDMAESFGHYRIDVDVLIEKSLLSKSEYGLLSMHDLLKEMGQEIVQRECPQEPGKRSRIFCLEDLYQVLKNDAGTDAIKGIAVYSCPEMKQRLNAKALSKMTKLRFFKFHHSQSIKWHGKPLNYMQTNELRFIEWFGYHLKSWPSSFKPKNLTVLRMYSSQIKQLWKGSMDLDNLKELDMGHSENLIETPDLSGAPNLEIIDFQNCRSLCEVHPSIKELKQLKQLSMAGTGIKHLWKGTLVVLHNLKFLALSYCKNLIETPDLTGTPNLEEIYFTGCTNLCEVHPSIKVLKQIKKIMIIGTGIKQLWKGSLMDLDNLKKLDMGHSENLIETPDLSGAPNLEIIDFQNCRSLCEVHPSIKELKQLKQLSMAGTGIKHLWKGTLVVLHNLKILNLSNCKNLIETPDLTRTPNLEEIDFTGCTNLCEVHPSIKVLKQIKKIMIIGTGIKQLWKGSLMVLHNLKKLHMGDSENLIETPDLSGAPNLEIIYFQNCRSLCEVHPSIKELKQLKELSMIGTGIKHLWKGTLVVLHNLKILALSYCKNLIETPDLTGTPNLEEIYFTGCTNLCEVHPSIKVLKQIKKIMIIGTGIKQLWKGSLMDFDNLKELDMGDSENLIETSDLSGAPNPEIIDFQNCRSLCEVHPSIKELKQLKELSMIGTGIKHLWKGTLVVLHNLKILNLSDCKNLIETPDLTGTPNLEEIYFIGCTNLREVHPSIKELKQLKELSMIGTGIKHLWKGTLVVLHNLKILDLTNCKNLIELPDLTGAQNLEEIYITGCTSLCEVHPSIKVLKQIQKIIIIGTGIKQLWNGSLMDLDNLKELDMGDSENLIETPDLSGAPNLEIIDFQNCRSLCEVHPSIKELKQLKELSMIGTGIKQLWNGTLVGLDNLKILDLGDCKNLIETPDLSGTPNLEEIDFIGCTNLCEVHPSIKVLKQIQKIIMAGTGIKHLWKGTSVGLDNLKILDLGDCKNLIEIPDLTGAQNLEEIYVTGCLSFCKVHPSIKVLKQIQKIIMAGTGIKQLWEGTLVQVLQNLKILDLSNCKNLIEIPDLTGAQNLEEIYLTGCTSLCEDHRSMKVLKQRQKIKMVG
ncbi:disease resistance protein RPV1-like isoform X4 [Carya illinoinensis]|uniref:disease resistance protein RPV1-like isoform X4 n=1 Tax=Carya illinoinensis TaxID=32201 RepID=UPI001C7234F5|nr:disease resistance protein RPV1-like isoform X4 [Carya illinoinensis]